MHNGVTENGAEIDKFLQNTRARRIAFYGGSFDPVHDGHLAIAKALIKQFSLDMFVFVPAFHAPHKRRKTPTSAFDRFTMLCLATESDPMLYVSRIEVELPERPYTVQTLTRLHTALSEREIFFVMGADSWMDITSWHQWEEVLTKSNHIVVTRPGFEISDDHVTPHIQTRIVDLRGGKQIPEKVLAQETAIYFTDTVNLDVSASEIRRKVIENEKDWIDDVPVEVANYIKKYQIYR